MLPVLPVAICCITLLSLEEQLLALPVGHHLEETRRIPIEQQHKLEEVEAPKAGLLSSPRMGLDKALEAKRGLWRGLLFRGQPPRQTGTAPQPLYASRFWPKESAARSERQRSRARRHVHNGSRTHHHQHAQLMRVGCVLGTCQVQNLSHRLYQLIGQSGREDTSPINPRSPHSYG